MADVSNIQRALYLLRKKEVDAAIRLLKATTQGLPAHLMAHVLLARAYELQHQWDDALAAWDEAHLLMPTSPLVQAGRERVLRKRSQHTRHGGDTADIAELLRDISDTLAEDDKESPDTSSEPFPGDEQQETSIADAEASAETAPAETAPAETDEDDGGDDAAHSVLEDLLASESETPTGEIEIPQEDDLGEADLDAAVGDVLAMEGDEEDTPETPDAEADTATPSTSDVATAGEPDDTPPEPTADASEPEPEKTTSRNEAEALMPTNVFLSGGPPDEEEDLDEAEERFDDAAVADDDTEASDDEAESLTEAFEDGTEADVAEADGAADGGEADDAARREAYQDPAADAPIADDTDTDDEDTLPDLPGSAELLDAIQSNVGGDSSDTDATAESEGDDSGDGDADTPADESMSELEQLRERAIAEARMGGSRPGLAASQTAPSESEDDEAADDDDASTDEITGDLDRLIQDLESARITPNPTPDSIEDDAGESSVPGIDLEEDDPGEMVSETLGRIYASQGRYREAARIYVKLAAQEPEDARTHLETASQLRAKSDAIRDARNETRRSDDA